MVTLTAPTYHALAYELLTVACNGEAGRDEDDPVYQFVTEGRDVGAMQKKYSSCGDLAHWLYWTMGVRLPWVNREPNGGWRVGQNVSLLAWCPQAQSCDNVLRFEPGDVVIIWGREDTSDAHVMVVLEQESPQVLLVAEYGQPGGRVNRRSRLGGKIGARRLRRHIPLEAVIAAAEEAGQLEPIDGPAVLASVRAIDEPTLPA